MFRAERIYLRRNWNYFRRNVQIYYFFFLRAVTRSIFSLWSRIFSEIWKILAVRTQRERFREQEALKLKEIHQKSMNVERTLPFKGKHAKVE